jgi:hypothetical protein
MGLADIFTEVVDSLPDDWTDLEIDLRIFDERRYVEAATLMVTCNAQPYSKHDWHWRLLVAHRFGHASAVPAGADRQRGDNCDEASEYAPGCHCAGAADGRAGTDDAGPQRLLRRCWRRRQLLAKPVNQKWLGAWQCAANQLGRDGPRLYRL